METFEPTKFPTTTKPTGSPTIGPTFEPTLNPIVIIVVGGLRVAIDFEETCTAEIVESAVARLAVQETDVVSMKASINITVLLSVSWPYRIEDQTPTIKSWFVPIQLNLYENLLVQRKQAQNISDV